jgi:hypothetical protein
MSIKDRILRLEDRGDAERCRKCRLRPATTYTVYPDEEDCTLPVPEHCPKCGHLVERFVLRVVYEDQEGGG